MALKRVWMRSPSYYTGNSGRRLIVIHSSEGAQTYQSLGNFFANVNNQVSSHVGIDDAVRGTVGEYVHRYDTAWTAGNANGVAVQAELCTPSGASANWSSQTWKNHDTMLRNLADWLREESNATGIPLVKLTPGQAQGTGRGVCQHKDLGAWGGGHVDCGPGFPMDYVMDLAKGTTTTATPETEIDDVFYLVFNVGSNRTTVVVPDQYAKGKHKLTLGCAQESQVRVDLVNADQEKTRTLSVANKAETVDIPKDNWFIVVNRFSGDEPIACAFSER